MAEDRTLRAYALLCDQPPDEDALTAMERARGGYYRTRSIKSGPLLEVEAYPIPARGQAERIRRIPVNREAIARQNARNAEKQLVRLIEGNFGKGDYYFTGTIAGDNLPTVEGMQKLMRRFVARLNYARQKKGIPKCRYVYVIEGAEDGSRKTRIHAHMVLDGLMDRSEVKRIWGRGRAQCDELDPEGYGGLTPLARYMGKNPQGKKRWAASKGLKQPIVRTADRKVTDRKAWQIASDRAGAAAALERLYPGYEHIETEVRTSPYLPGAYIYAVLRRKTGEKGETGG